MGALAGPFGKHEKEWEFLFCLLASLMPSTLTKRIIRKFSDNRGVSDAEKTERSAGWKRFIRVVRPSVSAPSCIPLGNLDAS
jgi:hypothetical protein